MRRQYLGKVSLKRYLICSFTRRRRRIPGHRWITREQGTLSSWTAHQPPPPILSHIPELPVRQTNDVPPAHALTRVPSVRPRRGTQFFPSRLFLYEDSWEQFCLARVNHSENFPEQLDCVYLVDTGHRGSDRRPRFRRWLHCWNTC